MSAQFPRLATAIYLRLLAAATVAAALALPAAIHAQTPIFRASTRVVSLFATVFDAKGRLVPDLVQRISRSTTTTSCSRLTLFDNKIQPITVVVMLDTSLSMTGSMKQLQDAAEQFVLRLLPDDKAKVGAFNDKIEVSDEFTATTGSARIGSEGSWTSATRPVCGMRSAPRSTS